MELNGEQLQLRYIPLDQVALWDENPKRHSIERLIESILRYGFVDPPKFDPNLRGDLENGSRGALVFGNGRAKCVKLIRDDPNRKGVPRGVCLDKDGNWFLPVLFGVDAESEAVAKALAIDHNALTLGDGFDQWEMARLWNQSDYAKVLGTLRDENSATITMNESEIENYLRTVNSQVEAREYNESIAEGVTVDAVFRIKLPVDEAGKFEIELDQLLQEFPSAKKDKVI